MSLHSMYDPQPGDWLIDTAGPVERHWTVTAVQTSQGMLCVRYVAVVAGETVLEHEHWHMHTADWAALCKGTAAWPPPSPNTAN